MKKTRQNVFETNSSSTHSITFSENIKGVYNTLPVNDLGQVEIHVSDNGYGWDVDEYTDPHSKAEYIYIYIRDWYNKYKKDPEIDYLKCRSDEDKDWIYLKNEALENQFKRIIMEHTGAESVVIYDNDGSNGYIDHQSVEFNELDWLVDSDDKLKEFIFDPECVLITDNDNY